MSVISVGKTARKIAHQTYIETKSLEEKTLIEALELLKEIGVPTTPAHLSELMDNRLSPNEIMGNFGYKGSSRYPRFRSHPICIRRTSVYTPKHFAELNDHGDIIRTWTVDSKRVAFVAK